MKTNLQLLPNRIIRVIVNYVQKGKQDNSCNFYVKMGFHCVSTNYKN